MKRCDPDTYGKNRRQLLTYFAESGFANFRCVSTTDASRRMRAAIDAWRLTCRVRETIVRTVYKWGVTENQLSQFVFVAEVHCLNDLLSLIACLEDTAVFPWGQMMLRNIKKKQILGLTKSPSFESTRMLVSNHDQLGLLCVVKQYGAWRFYLHIWYRLALSSQWISKQSHGDGRVKTTEWRKMFVCVCVYTCV